MQDSMKDKLTALCLRSEDVTRELAAPETASDRKRFQALCREQNELAPVVETFREYQKQEQKPRNANHCNIRIIKKEMHYNRKHLISKKQQNYIFCCTYE